MPAGMFSEVLPQNSLNVNFHSVQSLNRAEYRDLWVIALEFPYS